MTCIIGMQKDEKVYIGADNIASTNELKQSREDKKVFIKNNMIFGCTSSYRIINLLQYQLVIPDYHLDVSIDQYMYTDFIEEVIKLFKDKCFSTIDNNVISGGNFIVGFKGKLYEIDNDFQIAKPSDGFSCIGSGYQYAYGAMKALKKYEDKLLSTEDIIKEALGVSEYYNPFVRKPFTILNI